MTFLPKPQLLRLSKWKHMTPSPWDFLHQLLVVNDFQVYQLLKVLYHTPAHQEWSTFTHSHIPTAMHYGAVCVLVSFPKTLQHAGYRGQGSYNFQIPYH